jgi:hypothetical protein
MTIPRSPAAAGSSVRGVAPFVQIGLLRFTKYLFSSNRIIRCEDSRSQGQQPYTCTDGSRQGRHSRERLLSILSCWGLWFDALASMIILPPTASPRRVARPLAARFPRFCIARRTFARLCIRNAESAAGWAAPVYGGARNRIPTQRASHAAGRSWTGRPIEGKSINVSNGAPRARRIE